MLAALDPECSTHSIRQLWCSHHHKSASVTAIFFGLAQPPQPSLTFNEPLAPAIDTYLARY
jgi:hypothetical protein